MTPIALTYLTLGLSILIWPLAVLLFRRRVLNAQWLIAIAMLLMAVSVILYGCLFNSFLQDEYLLLLLFMILSLATPPTTMLALAALTRPSGIGFKVRAAFLVPLLMAVVMAAMAAMGDTDTYRLWLHRGTLGQGYRFVDGDMGYNVIVFVHYYLYTAILIVEVLAMVLYVVLAQRRYGRTLREYYTPAARRRDNLLVVVGCMTFVGLLSMLSLVVFPLNSPRPVGFVIGLSLVEGVALAIVGYRTYSLNYGAELLGQSLCHTLARHRKDLVALGRDISRHVEDGAFSDPDLSVFVLAEHFHVAQDQVVDAIHHIHGVTFADYVDSLRIEHANAMFLAASHVDDEFIARVAHRCGYLDVLSLQRAYRKVMRETLPYGVHE